MNAPYKTEPINKFKRSKSSSLIRSSLSTNLNSNLNDAPILVNNTDREIISPEQTCSQRDALKAYSDLASSKQLSTSSFVQKVSQQSIQNLKQLEAMCLNEAKNETNLVIKTIKFKDVAPSLSLEPRLANLINNNLKLNLSIENVILKKKRQLPNEESNSFISRLKQNVKRSNYLNLHTNFQLMQMNQVIKKGTHVLNKNFLKLNYNENDFRILPKS